MAPDWAATARGWARPAKAAVPAMTVLRESCGLIAAPGGVSPDLPRPEPTGRTPWPPEALALRTAGVTAAVRYDQPRTAGVNLIYRWQERPPGGENRMTPSRRGLIGGAGLLGLARAGP